MFRRFGIALSIMTIIGGTFFPSFAYALDVPAPGGADLATPENSLPDTDCPEDFYNYNDILLYSRCAKPPTSCFGSGNVTANGTEVGTNFSLGNNAAERQINFMTALMADYGLTAQQAAGVAGNFMHESGGKDLPPDVNQGGAVGPPRFSGGYGWAQWTGPRQHTFINYAVRQGYMASDKVNATDAANYAYFKTELATSYQSTIPALKTTSTPEAAARSFEHTFEAAGNPLMDARIKNANDAFATFQAASGQPTSAISTTCNSSDSGATIVGNTAFPLAGTKKVVKNPGMFRNNTADRGGHPYIAFDILANPGSQVVAFLSGKVMRISTDRCPGRMVSIYNAESNLTISYLHMDMEKSTLSVGEGDTVTVGQKIGLVGPGPAGCGTPHLHIDAVTGKIRVGCSRLKCPESNQKYFRDIGPQLYTTFMALPE